MNEDLVKEGSLRNTYRVLGRVAPGVSTEVGSLHLAGDGPVWARSCHKPPPPCKASVQIACRCRGEAGVEHVQEGGVGLG